MTVNGTFKAEVKRLWDIRIAKNPLHKWNGTDNAVCALRTILTELGCLEMLKPEHAEARQAAVDAILPIFSAGAPINFRRGFMVSEKIAPALPKGESESDTADDAV